MKLSEAANRVIDLAGKVRDYYNTELPKYHPNYPIITYEEPSAPPPPEEKQLRDFFSSLSDDLIYQLMVISQLGRGEIGMGDMAEYYEAWKVSFGDREQTVSQMMAQALLADYLLDGLEELRKTKINVDKMSWKKLPARKR